MPLRVWGAVGYALLPPVLGAVATGRLGTAVAAVLLPLLALAVVRALGLDDRPPSWRAGWAAGLLLAVMAAFVPMAWLIAWRRGRGPCAGARHREPAPLAAAGCRAGARAAAAPAAVAAALVADPQLLLLEAGLPGPGLSEPDLDGLDLLLLHPGGPGLPPLVARRSASSLAALAGLLRPTGRRAGAAGLAGRAAAASPVRWR